MNDSQEPKEVKEPQPTGEYFITNKEGDPFALERVAKAEITRRGLDPRVCQIIGNEKEGFTIRVGTPQPEVEYWWVIFDKRRHQNDFEKVFINFDGDMMEFERGVEVICPSTHLEIIDHAVETIYKQTAETGLEVVGEVQRYSYRKIRPSTRQEYTKLLAKYRRKK